MIGLHFLSSNLAILMQTCENLFGGQSAGQDFRYLTDYRFYLLADRPSRDDLRVPPITL